MTRHAKEGFVLHVTAAMFFCSVMAPETLQAHPTHPSPAILPLKTAQRAATAALNHCEQGGYHVSVSVVDAGGNVKTLVRGDGAGPHTQDSSFKKAYTSASIRRSTTELAELIAKIPTLQALREMNDNILILGGGMPVVINGTVVGGIGVGGAPGTHLDDACAQAGIDAITPSAAQPSLE